MKNNCELTIRHYLCIFGGLAALVVFCVLWMATHPNVMQSAQAAPTTPAAPAVLAPATTTSAVVTSVAEQMRFRAFVPGLKSSVRVLKATGNVRVTLEFEAKDAEEVQKAFAQKGVPFYLDVRGIR